MPDHDAHAARIAGLIDWNPTCLPGQHETTIVRQILDSAASLGLLADPEQRLTLDTTTARLNIVRAERDALQRQVDGFKRVRDDVDELLIAALGPHAEPGGGGWYADVSQLIAERDLARWLHAELQHKLTLPCGSCHPCMNWADETWRRADRKPPTVGRWEDKLAETRGLYARLDDAIQLIEEMSNHLRQDPALAIGVETRLAALRADEPSEPETGCMDGPAKQHTLHMVGIIKALKSAAGMDHLPLEPPGRDNFARLARAIADYWPREIDRPTSEPTGEVDRG